MAWALLYFAAGVAGLSLAGVHPSATLVWPPSGIAVAALLLRGTRLWPAVTLGAFAVNLFVSRDVMPSLGIAVGNTLEAILATWLVGSQVRRPLLESVSSSLRFILGAGLLAPLVGASVGGASLYLADPAVGPAAWSIWLTWYMGDSGGVLIFGALLLAWTGPVSAYLRTGGRVEAALLALFVLVAGSVVFHPALTFPGNFQPLKFLCLPPLLWASVRFGARGASACTFLLSALFLLGAARASDLADPAYQGNLMVIQAFLGVCAMTGLVMAAVTAERYIHEQALLDAQRDLEERVTERTREAIRNETRFRSLFEFAPDAMVMVDSSRAILLVNDQVERVFGYPSEEIVGQPIEVLIPERFRAAHGPHMARYFSSPQFRPMGSGLRLFGQRKSGEEFPVEISLSPFSTDEGMVALASIRDITERKLLEEKEQALIREQAARAEAEAAVKAREGFLAIASHELSTPLAALKMQISNLVRTIERTGAESIPADRLLSVLTGLARMTRRIQTLVTGMLDISRIQTGQFRLKKEPMDLAALVREVVDRYRPEIELSGSRVEVTASTPVEGCWDRERLDQVITNLLTNALRYGDKGPIRLRVIGDSTTARLIVEDEGIGIAKENQEQVFAAFRQGPGAAHERGLGLGLYIVREIMRGHDGRVTVESELGKGSTFTVELPL